MVSNREPAEGRVGDERVDELVTALLTASRVLVGVSATSLAGLDEGVTISQFRTLVVLGAHGPTRLNSLAERLGVNASTALRTVDKLVAGGFAERRENEQDRREVVIEPTASGRQLVDRVTARRRAAIEDIVVAMPPGHRRHLVEALLSFAAAADEPLAFADSATRLGW